MQKIVTHHTCIQCRIQCSSEFRCGLILEPANSCKSFLAPFSFIVIRGDVMCNNNLTTQVQLVLYINSQELTSMFPQFLPFLQTRLLLCPEIHPNYYIADLSQYSPQGFVLNSFQPIVGFIISFTLREKMESIGQFGWLAKQKSNAKVSFECSVGFMLLNW